MSWIRVVRVSGKIFIEKYASFSVPCSYGLVDVDCIEGELLATFITNQLVVDSEECECRFMIQSLERNVDVRIPDSYTHYKVIVNGMNRYVLFYSFR